MGPRLDEESPYYESLIEEFRNEGYVDGRNLAIEHRFPDEKPELFTALVAELVSLKPDVLVGAGIGGGVFQEGDGDDPPVVMYVPDPVGAGPVESVRRPGGNATGLTNVSVDLSAKRLQYLKEIVPALSRVALLINPTANTSRLYVRQSNEAAPKLPLAAQAFDVSALGQLDQWVWVKEMVEAGALVSDGVDQRGIARRVAGYVARILKGEKPAGMPVEQPTTFEVAINMRTAKGLGLARDRRRSRARGARVLSSRSMLPVPLARGMSCADYLLLEGSSPERQEFLRGEDTP